MLKSFCKYCEKYFLVKDKELYCCKRCSSQKGKKICSLCNKEFTSNAEKFLCSNKCLNKYLEKNNLSLKSGKGFFWKIVLNAIKSNSKVVKKTWGFEVHIVNNNNYCLKYLVYFKNKESSLHFHKIKTELWHCLCGSFFCKLKKKSNIKKFLINAGDKLEINPGEIHQLKAKEDSIILEVSTRDYPEDSIRKIPSPTVLVGEGKNFIATSS